MVLNDPYSATGAKRLECERCLTRIDTADHVDVCPNCGGLLRNLSVARE